MVPAAIVIMFAVGFLVLWGSQAIARVLWSNRQLRNQVKELKEDITDKLLD
jgi:hypothetical protein